MVYPKAPLPDDFREKYEALDSEGALIKHYGGDKYKIRRWCTEAGLPPKVRQLKPIPAGFTQAHADGATNVQLMEQFGLTEQELTYLMRRRLGLRSNLRGPTHGLPSTYNNGCRCVPCTEAASARKYDGYLSRRAETEANGGIAPVDTHNANTYTNWGCRCDECVEAKLNANRSYYYTGSTLTPLQRQYETPADSAIQIGHTPLPSFDGPEGLTGKRNGEMA